ncbi:MAG: hypothetical protein IPG12_05150 [Saprospiraceae bacterium]|nr:hypothetical protein [Saprospiraceae bacterium]
MPSRIAQTLCTTLFLLTLFFIDKSTEDSLWVLIPTGILALASFVFGSLINQKWYQRNPPKLSDYELNWVKRFVPFYKNLPKIGQDHFCNQLAIQLTEKQFTSMSEKEMPEELKIMALAPAIRLNLSFKDPAVKHYGRIVFYHHAFPSPEQQYLHLSETQDEDGVIILASDALEAAYVKPDAFFNIALYEWACIFIKIHKMPATFKLDADLIWSIICKILVTEEKKLQNYMGQMNLNIVAILVYCYIMYPEKLQKESADIFNFYKTIID